jgi:hypothetical protein
MSDGESVTLRGNSTPSESEITIDGGLRLKVKECLLSGVSGATAITKAIGDSDGKNVSAVRWLLNDGVFLREVEQARLNIEDTVIKWFKRRALQYAKQMDELAKNPDPRVAFQANKDALDRIGTKPTERVNVSGLDQYRALIEGLRGGEEEKSDG